MRKIVFWILAVVITAATLFYQRVTGPTYELRGKTSLAGTNIKFELPRSHEITSDCEIAVKVVGPEIFGRLLYKRFKTSDPWTEIPLSRRGESLVGYLPRQPMAGKLAYRVLLSDQEKEVSLSGEDPVVIRFKGEVPMAVLILHVLVIFSSMLLSTRAGLAVLEGRKNLHRLALATTILLFVGGFILGPLMQKFAFDAWWTGFPLGKDLTDTKTLAAMVLWIAALVKGRRGKPNRGWVLAASILTLVVFLIPHSLLGSELKYTDVPPQENGLSPRPTA
jgi:hypothetical protein